MKAIYETPHGWPVEVQLLGYSQGPSVWAEKMIVVRVVQQVQIVMPEVNFNKGDVLEVHPSRLWKRVKSVGEYHQRWEYIGHPDLSGLAACHSPYCSY